MNKITQMKKFNHKLIPPNGFSLIELIVVLIITAILSQIGFIAFNRYTRRSRAFTAETSLKNLRSECERNRDLGLSSTFTLLPVKGYSIATRNDNSCLGQILDGKVAALSNNPLSTPNYFYDYDKGEISCNYKNSSDNLFKNCNDLKSDLENKSFVVKDSYLERGCSAYVVVDGETWDLAEANSQRLGGHLVSINDESENNFLTEKIKWDTPIDKDKGAYGYAKKEYGKGWTAYWIGLKDTDQEGKLKWSDGSTVDYVRKVPSDSRGNEDWQTLISNGEWNDIDQTGSDGGTEHWQMKMGIAEIPKC